MFTEHLDLSSQPIENSFAKQRIIFHSDPSAAMNYPFLSLDHHKPAWTRHFQGITIHRSPLFWKSHYLILLASHLSTLLPRDWFSFPLCPYLPQFPKSGISPHCFNKGDINKNTFSALGLLGGLKENIWMCFVNYKILRKYKALLLFTWASAVPSTGLKLQRRYFILIDQLIRCLSLLSLSLRLTLIKHLLCEKQHAGCWRNWGNHFREMFIECWQCASIFTTVLKIGIWDPERLSNLPKAIQPVSGEAGIWIQISTLLHIIMLIKIHPVLYG